MLLVNFSDLALTIAVSVFISLLVALKILPVAAKIWLKQVHHTDRLHGLWQTITNKLMVVPVALTAWLLPPLDYLPPVKRDAVDAFVSLLSSGASNIYWVSTQVIHKLKKQYFYK